LQHNLQDSPNVNCVSFDILLIESPFDHTISNELNKYWTKEYSNYDIYNVSCTGHPLYLYLIETRLNYWLRFHYYWYAENTIGSLLLDLMSLAFLSILQTIYMCCVHKWLSSIHVCINSILVVSKKSNMYIRKATTIANSYNKKTPPYVT